MMPNDHPTHATLGTHTFRGRAIRTAPKRKVIPDQGRNWSFRKCPDCPRTLNFDQTISSRWVWASVNIPRGLASLDRGKDRLQ